jgi:pimeloyl-ACP methyl ester carboxylesterase
MGETILFAHGWAACRQFWSDVIAALEPRYRCVAPDLPGFGDESRCPPASCSMESYARVIREWARRSGARTVVAHSMGAMAAALWAAEADPGPERLVLVNVPVRGATALTPKSRLLLLPGARWLVFHFSRIRAVRRRVARDFTFRRELPDGLLDGILRPTYRVAFRSVEWLMRTDLRPCLPRIRARTLVVVTDRDLVINPQQGRLAAAGIPDARLVEIRDCGHVPMIEKPEEFTRVLEEFLCNA